MVELFFCGVKWGVISFIRLYNFIKFVGREEKDVVVMGESLLFYVVEVFR